MKKTNQILLAIDAAALGGGGGYSGEISTKTSSGGTNRAAFGAINFGDNASVGGTSAGDGGSNTLVYIAIAALALFFLFKR